MAKSIESYSNEYVGDFGFEAEMVRYRCALVMERLAHFRPRTVVELGCGTDLQAERYRALGGSWDRWTVVEPADLFADHARAASLPDFEVVQGFFEDVLDRIPDEPDLILCSGLLHEVPDSDRFIASVCAKMGAETVVHFNVPNAQSMHRRLARSMGLIEDVKTVSQRNISLQQPRVYDLPDLAAQLKKHGLKISATGGHLIKPFTHKQMEPLVSSLGRDVMDGLFKLGKELPDLASEIYAEATLD